MLFTVHGIVHVLLVNTNINSIPIYATQFCQCTNSQTKLSLIDQCHVFQDIWIVRLCFFWGGGWVGREKHCNCDIGRTSSNVSFAS